MGQDTTRYRGFPRRSRFWLVSRFGLSFWSCLDTTMKWKRTLMSPLASIFFFFLSLRLQRFSGQAKYIHNSAHRGGCMHLLGPLPPPSFVLDFPFTCTISFLIIASLPRRYLETLQLSRDTPSPWYGNTFRTWLSRLSGTWSSKHAHQASVASQARSEGVGYVMSEEAVALEIVEAVNDAVVRGMGLGR